MASVLYSLEQGIENPRENNISWLGYEAYPTRALAIAEARKHRGDWRVVEMRIVWQEKVKSK